LEARRKYKKKVGACQRKTSKNDFSNSKSYKIAFLREEKGGDEGGEKAGRWEKRGSSIGNHFFESGCVSLALTMRGMN